MRLYDSVGKRRCFSLLLVMVQFSTSGVLVLTTRWTDFTPFVLVVGGLGIGLWGWAVATMKFNRLSIQPEVRNNANLVTDGPFRLIRHPMYSGLILFSLAFTLASFQLWRFLIWIALLAVLIVKAGLEERLLSGQFPGYNEYRRQTKRFVPFLF